MVNDVRRIATWLRPEKFLLSLDVRHRQHALEVIGEEIERAHRLEPGVVFRALWRREQAGSTGLGGGFAVPHASVVGISQPLTVFLRPKVPIDFEAPDHQPVSEVLAILAPVGGSKEDHLQLLALVAEMFSDRAFRRHLQAATDATDSAAAFEAAIARWTDAPR